MIELKDRLKKLVRPFGDPQIRDLVSQNVLKDTIDRVMAYVEFDDTGKVMQANDIFLEWLGYNSEVVIGQHHRIFCDAHFANSPEYEEFWNHLLAGEPMSGEFQRISQFGEYVWLNASYTPVLDHNGAVVKIIKIASNITNMVKSRNQAAWVKSAVDTGWSRVEFGIGGTILDANKNFLELFGYTEEEILGKHHQVFCDPEYVESSAYTELWEGFANGEIAEGEHKRVSKSGDTIYIYATYTPVRNNQGEVEKVVKIASDITNVKKDGGKFHSILDQINELSAVVTDSSEDMSGRASAMTASTIEMSSAIEQMTRGARDQSIQLEEISGFLEGLLHAAEDSSRKATDIRSVAKTGANQAMNGKKKLGTLIENIHGIISNSEVVERSIKELVRKSGKISSALNVITEISARTNLLSLNASIQAARAGSAGKAFSVVAEEIRSLADESKGHVKSIDQVIAEIQDEIKKAEAAIVEMNESVDSGSETSKEADSAFVALEQSTANTLDQAQEIEAFAAVQTQSITKIVEAVERVVVVAEQTAAGTEELASSSTGIRDEMIGIEQTSLRLQALTEELQLKINQR